MFKNNTTLGKKFHFKDQIPKDLTSGLACICNESYYGECVKNLNVRIGGLLVYHHSPKNKLSVRTAP